MTQQMLSGHTEKAILHAGKNAALPNQPERASVRFGTPIDFRTGR